MKSPLRWTLALVLVAGLLSGCGKKNSDPVSPVGGGPSSTNEQIGASSALASTPQLVEDGIFESADQGAIGGMPGTVAAIRPLTYWRTITSVERRFEFAFADTDSAGRPTTAVVTIHKFLKGSFNILPGPRPEPGVRDSANLRPIRKPLDDHWVRRVLLKRLRPMLPPGGGDARQAECNDPHGMWRVAASSGVEVTSRGATTHIVSLRIQTATRDTVVTDPLAFFRLKRLLKFDVADSVKLTVTTERNDDVVVLIHRGLRFMFRNNGDNTYTGIWRAPRLAGLEHIGVNAFSHGTLFDDVLPYDSQAWILPYIVHPMELAEYMP